MINVQDLGNVPGPEMIRPTFEDLTLWKHIVILMKDGSVDTYVNDAGIVEEDAYEDMKAFIETTNLEDFSGTYWVNFDLVECVQEEFPEVERIYLAEL